MKNNSNARYILVVDSSTWMSVHKGWIFSDVAKSLGFKIIRVAPDVRLSWWEDVFILDPLFNERVLLEKLKKYKNQIAYIFPTFDFASTLLAPVATALNAPFLCPQMSKNLGTKSALANYLRSQKLGTPGTWLVTSLATFEDIPEDIPLVVKANVSTGSLKKHDWDYRVFENKDSLLVCLKESQQLEAFIANGQSQDRYQSVIQEYIAGERYLDVHVVFAKPGVFKTYLIGEFSTHPQGLHIVESKSVQNLEESIAMQVSNFVSFFSRNGCENMLANLQFVVRDGCLYLFDLNLRVAGIWSYLHKIMMPDFPNQVLSFFEGNEVEFKLMAPCYLKTPYYLDSGKTIDSITAPTTVDRSVLLAYLDHLVPGYRVPEEQNSIQPSPQIFAVGSSEDECRRKIQDVLNNTQVHYRS